MNAQTAILADATSRRPGGDYETVRRVIEKISLDYRDQPSLEALAAEVGETPTGLQKLFTRWAGLSPKAFLQAVTLDHARRLLDEGMPLLETSYEVGMSGPGRLHDLFVTHEAMSPGDYKSRGGGLAIRYGFHLSPFGDGAGDGHGSRPCRSRLQRSRQRKGSASQDMAARWPNANYVEDLAATAPYAARIFDPARWRAEQPLRVVMIGTDFQVRVWEALLKIPMGKACSYSGHRPQHRPAGGQPRGRRCGRRQPAVLRGAVPPGARQVRRAHRLPLGADAQARYPRLGGRTARARCRLKQPRPEQVDDQPGDHQAGSGELPACAAARRAAPPSPESRTPAPAR